MRETFAKIFIIMGLTMALVVTMGVMLNFSPLAFPEG